MKFALFDLDEFWSEDFIEHRIFSSISSARSKEWIRMGELVSVRFFALNFDKWLFSSILQKSIRRGLVEVAIGVAMVLAEHESSYFWSRLPVVAIEDVGNANEDLCAEIFYISGKKSKISKLGERKLVAYFVGELSSGIKDRTASCLPCCVEHSLRLSGLLRTYEEMDFGDIVNLLQLDESLLFDQVVLFWLICGRGLCPSNSVFLSDIVNLKVRVMLEKCGYGSGLDFLTNKIVWRDLKAMPAFNDYRAWDGEGNAQFIYLFDSVARKLRCSMFLGFLFGGILLRRSFGVRVVNYGFSVRGNMASIPLSALDKHNLPGKMALREAFENISCISGMLNTVCKVAGGSGGVVDMGVSLFEDLLFVADGRLVDRELVYGSCEDGSSDLSDFKSDWIRKNSAKLSVCKKYAISDKEYDELLMLVSRNTDRVDFFRKKALRSLG